VNQPFVSIIVPIRNEAKYIKLVVESILAQNYPSDRLEVIIADGMSTDDTRQIIHQLIGYQPDCSIHVIDNPELIVSTGLNRAIKQANGEVLIRIDGHTEVAKDFVRQNVTLLQLHPEAWSVGGPLQCIGDTTFGQAVAKAMSHPLGIGNAMHHYSDFEGYTQGAPFPAFRREVFDRIGYFDEDLVRNQDDNFNYRIIEAGGKIFISPLVKSKYFVRDSPKLLFKQYFQYGFWRIVTLKKHKHPTTIRQVIPTLFYISVFMFFLTGFLLRQLIIALGLPLVYIALLSVIGISSSIKSGWEIAWRVPVAMGIMHAGYAFGYFYGILGAIFYPSIISRYSHMGKVSR
jgi:glycosyltransferase involved in cell wall biosynthesis